MKLIFACGGSGGHIFPAFSVAEELQKRDPSTQIIYVCGKLDIESEIFTLVIRPDVPSCDGTATPHNRGVLAVESAPFRGARSLLSPVFLLKLAKGLISAVLFLRHERPDAVVGFGGYFSFPVVVAAKLCGIRCLIHEQNVEPGVANLFLNRWVDGTALSYPETEARLGGARPRLKVTGNPIRSAIENGPSRAEALSFFAFEAGKRTILVLGGSQGAESINTLFLSAMGFLSGRSKQRIQVLHLCGRMDPSEAERKFREAQVSAKAFSFFGRMDLAYAVTDVAVGRAGATFLAEISAKNIPAVLIPYPFGSGHQRLNAEIFSRDHRAVVALQAELTAGALAGHIEALLLQGLPNKRDSKGVKAREILADFITEIASDPHP